VSRIETPVAWLRCFPGIDTVAAMSLLVELHDFGRFQSARELDRRMAELTNEA
jgi:hypothetical protein